MKVSELEGAELDFWVAGAHGFSAYIAKAGCILGVEHAPICMYTPSTDWKQGGPIIERVGIELTRSIRYLNIARIPGFYPELTMPGTKPLIAAMRCFVASKYGEEVPE
jgi:hypothetical protein